MIIDRKGLIQYAKDNFKISLDGYHGTAHWSRVKNIGQRLCDHVPDADRTVVELFAWTHDMARFTEHHDTEHGKLAIGIIESEIQGTFVDLSTQQLDHLIEAVEWHSHGEIDAHPTVQVCWDSDRLDLGRVGVIPDPQRLCTDIGKHQDTLKWAYENSLKIYTPKVQEVPSELYDTRVNELKFALERGIITNDDYTGLLQQLEPLRNKQ